MNACVIYDSNTGAVALSPAEAATNVVRQGRNEAAIALRKEAERFGDDIEYVVYMGDVSYRQLQTRSVTTLWKEFWKEPHVFMIMGVALSMIFACGFLVPWAAVYVPGKTGETIPPLAAVIVNAVAAIGIGFGWRAAKDDRQKISHIKRFGFKNDFLPTARRYSQNMIGVGRDSLYVFAAPMSGDMTVNKIGYDQVQHVREKNGTLNIVSRGGQVIETVFNYESEYKGDVPSDIMNRHLEVTK